MSVSPELDTTEVAGRTDWPARRLSHFQGITVEVISQEGSLVTSHHPLPVALVTQYAHAAAERADIREDEAGKWVASIEGFPGVWVRESTPEEAGEVLREVVFEWALLKIRDKDRDLPVLEDLDLNTL